MKLVLKNCRIIMQSPKRTEIESVYNNKNGGVSYPGNLASSGNSQSWFFPLVKGATYELTYTGTVKMNIGSVWLCSLCKLEGDYTTMPQNEVAEEVFGWNKDELVQGGRFVVPSETDKDCIVVTGLKDSMDSDIKVQLVRLG